MKDFNRGGRSGGGGKRFGGGRDFNRGGRDSQRPSMHRAVCDECGNDCEVPFRPTGDKPIYCNNCFQGKRNDSPNKFGRKNFRRSDFSEKKAYAAVCSKCGKNCEVPFKPTEGKPVFCDECFGKRGNAVRKEAGRSNEQFEILNVKLDKILKLLSPVISLESVASKKAEEEVKMSESKKPSQKVVAEKIPAKKVAAKKIVAKKLSKKKTK